MDDHKRRSNRRVTTWEKNTVRRLREIGKSNEAIADSLDIQPRRAEYIYRQYVMQQPTLWRRLLKRIRRMM
jgi:FixJ family two-component response regulator